MQKTDTRGVSVDYGVGRMESAGATLKRMLPELVVSKQKLRQAEGSCIVPIYLVMLAVRQQSQTIRFRTAAEMLETFGMHKGGKEYRRLVAAFERIFGATIFFGPDTLNGRAKVVPALAIQLLQ